jgi:RNA polymerase sigma factor (sigma-70 family)
MKFDPADSTSETLLGRVGLSPSDTVAWARFVAVYGPKIGGWCRQWGLQEADADDVTQDVLLGMAKRLGTFAYDPSRSFRGWLRTVTQNALSHFVADRKRRCAGSGDAQVLELLQSVPAREDLMGRLEEQFDAEIVAEACDRARRRVEPRTWDAFQLMAREGVSWEEVAARLGMNAGSAFKAKSRVLEIIREEVRRLDCDV